MTRAPSSSSAARAGRDDHARELVAHHQRRRAVAHVAEVALDLRAADPDRLGPQDQLAGPGVGRLRLLLDRHPLRALPHDRPHGECLPGQREGKCGGRGEVDRRLDRLPRAHVVDEAAAVAGERPVAAGVRAVAALVEELAEAVGEQRAVVGAVDDGAEQEGRGRAAAGEVGADVLRAAREAAADADHQRHAPRVGAEHPVALRGRRSGRSACRR